LLSRKQSHPKRADVSTLWIRHAQSNPYGSPHRKACSFGHYDPASNGHQSHYRPKNVRRRSQARLVITQNPLSSFFISRISTQKFFPLFATTGRYIDNRWGRGGAFSAFYHWDTTSSSTATVFILALFTLRIFFTLISFSFVCFLGFFCAGGFYLIFCF